eukprot:2384231-Amphidinium_carterae.1
MREQVDGHRDPDKGAISESLMRVVQEICLIALLSTRTSCHLAILSDAWKPFSCTEGQGLEEVAVQSKQKSFTSVLTSQSCEDGILDCKKLGGELATQQKDTKREILKGLDTLSTSLSEQKAQAARCFKSV